SKREPTPSRFAGIEATRALEIRPARGTDARVLVDRGAADRAGEHGALYSSERSIGSSTGASPVGTGAVGDAAGAVPVAGGWARFGRKDSRAGIIAGNRKATTTAMTSTLPATAPHSPSGFPFHERDAVDARFARHAGQTRVFSSIAAPQIGQVSMDTASGSILPVPD